MKKKSGKRFLSWLLAVVMIIALMPATAFAEPPTESSGNTEPAVTSYCPSSEGGTDVSVGGYDSSPAAETKDTPTEEPAKDTPTAEPVKDTPTAEPVKESPVADKTTEGAPAQEGAVENSTDEKITKDLTNEVSAAELAGLIAMLGVPELPVIRYPIYVYGYFVNGKDNEDNDNILSGENIKIQKDGKDVRTVKWNGNDSESFITFGKIENGTSVLPRRHAKKEDIPKQTLKTMLSHSLNDTDKQNSYFSWEDVAIEDWDLHVSHGATDYPEVKEYEYSWHMDGKINVYKIKYLDGENGTDISNNYVDSDAYYCGTYTIGDAPTAPEGKTFAGWKVSYVVDGKTETPETIYNNPDVATSPKVLTLKEFGNAEKITLTAQWKDKTTDPEVPKYPVYVYGYFTHGDNTEHLTRDITVNGKEIEWNEDANLSSPSSPEYYITFGKIPEGTTETPTTENQTTDKFDKAKLAELKGDNLFNGTGSATSNKVSLDNVNSWGNVHACPGAASYNGTGGVTKNALTWHLDGAIKVYTVAYDANAGSDTVANMPTNPKGYFFGDFNIASEKPERDNYTFDYWMLNGQKVEGNKIENLSDNITLVAHWTKKTANVTVTFKIENGAWADNTTEDKVVTIPLTNGKGTLKDTDVPSGMLANTGYDNGKWDKQPNTAENAVTGDVTYTFSFAPKTEVQPDTILDVLNKEVTIEKFFKAQYNYSTEGTFTATAEVMVISRPEAISYTAEGDVPSDNNTNTPGTDKPKTKTFTGTVTLKTGEKRPFIFSAGEGVSDELEPYKHYAVYISEEKGNLSKVTYDTTKYFLGFTTGENSEVLSDSIYILAGEDIAEGEEGKEPTPVKGTTITFQNIYTYKRHHSSDNGNGGGKKEEKPTVEIKDDDALGLNNTDHFAYIVGYGNGEVRPQNSITRAEVAAIFFRLLEDDVRDANYTRQNKFTDVSNDAWYCSAVSTLSAMGIISGYPDATFRPNASITRAEFAAIATRFDVNGDKTPASFNDIAGHWAKDEIAVAANNGWVNGYEDGSFRPQNKITRAETMSLVNRVLNRKPETAEDLLENMTKWTDNADTNAWYYLAVQEATNSHYYEYKENSQYEKWTELRETRDWSELDK